MEAQGACEVVIRRETAYRDRLRKYKVLIDGNEVGHISAGDEERFPVTTGEHELQLKIDWKGSPALGFTAQPGSEARFVCSGKGASRTLIDLFKKSEAWIQLSAVDDAG